MKKQTDRATIREAFQLHWRGMKDVSRYCPGLFASIVCSAAVSAVIPYMTIYFSAQIIDELAGPRRPEQLMFWVWMTISVEALLGLTKAVLKHWNDAKEELFFVRKDSIFTDKRLTMDFADADRQEIHDKYIQICQSEGWGGWGLRYLPMYVACLWMGLWESWEPWR